MTDFFKIKTEEEIKEQIEKNKKEVLSMGFLPLNDELNSSMHCSMEEVEKEPRKYIIEECVPACEELWKKNIYTFMVSDHLNIGECWIEIAFNNLSDDNKEIYTQLESEDIIKFSYHKNCVNFGVKCVGLEAQTRLLEIAQQFKMQDVPYGEAYITLPDYLIRCGCYDEVENPNYVEMVEPWNMSLTVEQFSEYLEKYYDWENSNRSKKTLFKFNPQKVIKPLEEYFAETGAIYEDDRVYLNEYHYKKHMKYIDSISQRPGTKH